jgi:hypothetical protein
MMNLAIQLLREHNWAWKLMLDCLVMERLSHRLRSLENMLLAALGLDEIDYQYHSPRLLDACLRMAYQS